MRSLTAPSVLAAACAGILSMASPQQSDAALIGTDWLSPGDGLMVRDTTTHLEWLRLTETAGLSYAQVSAQFGAGGSFAGLRYASNAEVVALFGGYFGISLAAGMPREVPAYLDPGVRLASETLGDGVSGGTDPISGPNANYRLVGFTGEAMLSGSPFALGAVTRWSDTDYYTLKDPLEDYDFYAGDFDWIGSYLVRPTAAPVPAAVWLLGSGLVALAGLARRKTP